jgi:hypothetical protein
LLQQYLHGAGKQVTATMTNQPSFFSHQWQKADMDSDNDDKECEHMGSSDKRADTGKAVSKYFF